MTRLKGESALQAPIKVPPKRSRFQKILRDKWMYLLLLPGVIYFLLFKILPMWGVLLAFQNYSPFLGFWGSEWVGFEHFQRFFSDPDFVRLMRNTVILAIYDLIFFFPAPIILALLLNEVRISIYKRTIQTLVYVPHFMSWVIIASISYVFLTTSGGIINVLVERFTGSQISFLSHPDWFRPMIIAQIIWKESGWGTVIFLGCSSWCKPRAI